MKIINTFGLVMTSFAVMATFGGFAADNGRPGRSTMMQATNVARMPTMPVVSINSVGNPAVQNINLPVDTNTGGIIPTPIPNPDTPTPTPSKCEDGGVENSSYTATMCMNDVLQCINAGALQGGLNDMFNEDVRHAIMGGMRICQMHVDKCISEVRVNCKNVYHETTDVWLDFNSRIVQPEYYNFVLRKTGLTPHQAENTCLLLDRNAYGSSFAAVSDTNVVNTEYNNLVGAYNSANGGTLSKDNPQGVAVNTVGYDGNRGHYARWDASNAECLIRVGAYNKDKSITNSWLFGAVGNDNVAEVWQKAGSTFTCNKDLFGFSLMNDTKTAAVIGVGGGTLVGAAIGAGAGAAVYNKKAKEAQAESDRLAEQGANPCNDEEYRKKLSAKIMQTPDRKDEVLKTYLYESVNLKTDSQGKKQAEIDTASSNKLFGPDTDWYNLNKEQCDAILGLYSKAAVYKDAIEKCRNVDTNRVILNQMPSNQTAFEKLEIVDAYGNKLLMSGSVQCGMANNITDNQVRTFNDTCLFVPLQVGFAVEHNDSPFCNHNGKCLTVNQIENELSRMKSLLTKIEPVVPAGISSGETKLNKGKEIGKGLAIGAVTGAAAGGLATAITAFVERSNITCKVGDGLNSVALGKSHTIDSLKDFYVKWNLHLPDTVSPTSAVVDRTSWDAACAQFNGKLNDCPNVQINLKDAHGKYTLVQGACVVSGSVCITNDSVATSHGAK